MTEFYWTADALEGAYVYIGRIRNLTKKRYAKDYLDYMRGMRSHPKQPALSLMAAQAVRYELHRIQETR